MVSVELAVRQHQYFVSHATEMIRAMRDAEYEVEVASEELGAFSSPDQFIRDQARKLYQHGEKWTTKRLLKVGFPTGGWLVDISNGLCHVR